MAIQLQITTIGKEPGGDDLLDGLKTELEGLGLTDIKLEEEKIPPGTLPGLDISTIALIVAILSLGLEAIKFINSVIETAKEERRKFANGKGVEVKNVAKYRLKLIIDKKEICSMQIPPEKAIEEKKFIEKFAEMWSKKWNV